jgi:hypothetical protein
VQASASACPILLVSSPPCDTAAVSARLVPLLLSAGILCACGSASDSTSPATTVARTTTSAQITPIVVEAPTAGASVPTSFTVSGTASVFEATLFVELRRGGRVLEKKTVTASEGAPGRGTFSVELHASSAGAATVAVYSPSAADGSAQHEQDVHVTVTP